MPQYPTFYNPISYRVQYPPVDIGVFSSSVKTFQMLMAQGSVLLKNLGNPPFAHKLMELAQQGKQQEVNSLIQTIGLKVAVKTDFTPSGVVFILQPHAKQDGPECCTLTVAMKWGN